MAVRCILVVVILKVACVHGIRKPDLPHFDVDVDTVLETRSPRTPISPSGDLQITVNIYKSGLFRKKEELGGQQGNSAVCQENKCAWLQPFPVRSLYRMTPSWLGGSPTASYWPNRARCCFELRCWITPTYLNDPVTREPYRVLQLPGLYQGYYGVWGCWTNSCPGRCVKAATLMTFIVWERGQLIMKAFNAETHCKCTN